MLLMAVLLGISAQDSLITLTHPRPRAVYRTTIELPCGEDGTYVFAVENGGTASRLLTSTLDGEPVELRSDSASLRDAVQRLRDVSIHPMTCLYGAGALVVVHGVDTDSASGTYGERVRLGFRAELRPRPQ